MKKFIVTTLITTSIATLSINPGINANNFAQNYESKIEYDNLVQQLAAHLAATGIDKETDEYILAYNTKYLKKIGTPVALRLLDDLLKYDQYCDYCNKGIDLMESQKYAEAIIAFNSAIALDPKDSRVWDSRGTAHFSLGNFQQAINDYSTAINLSPFNGFLYGERALAYFKIGNINAMTSDLKMGASLGDADAQLMLNKNKH